MPAHKKPINDYLDHLKSGFPGDCWSYEGRLTKDTLFTECEMAQFERQISSAKAHGRMVRYERMLNLREEEDGRTIAAQLNVLKVIEELFHGNEGSDVSEQNILKEEIMQKVREES